MKDEFYIGWQDTASSGYQSGRNIFFRAGLAVLIVVSIGYLFLEHSYPDSNFDYGNLTEVTGTIVDYPVFGIKTEIDNHRLTVPLVGFGKFDATPVLKELKRRIDTLKDYRVTLRGTLIQFNGKSWMELTEGLESIVDIQPGKHQDQMISEAGERTLVGEIVDPKCFFGVMKPAYGKIHRSCAIRCISGGIPPILAIKEAGTYVDYYFLTDTKGEGINELVLPYIGYPVSVKGNAQAVDDWKVLRLTPGSLSESLAFKLDAGVELCMAR